MYQKQEQMIYNDVLKEHTITAVRKTRQIGKWIKRTGDKIVKLQPLSSLREGGLEPGSRDRKREENSCIKKYAKEKINRP